MPKDITCECGYRLRCYAFTNTCKCGRDYNNNGSKLAPRSQWGYETGETWEEIIDVDHNDQTEAINMADQNSETRYPSTEVSVNVQVDTDHVLEALNSLRRMVRNEAPTHDLEVQMNVIKDEIGCLTIDCVDKLVVVHADLGRLV